MQIANKNKSYKFKNHLVYSCQYHVIFCPKYRRKVLEGKIKERAVELFKEKAIELDGKILEIQVMPDHVHLLVESNPKVGIYKLIKALKGYTSNILRKEFPELKKRLPCLWSRNKFISSVGEVGLDVVKKYIEDQKNV